MINQKGSYGKAICFPKTIDLKTNTEKRRSGPIL
jgi:hypothetical protein